MHCEDIIVSRFSFFFFPCTYPLVILEENMNKIIGEKVQKRERKDKLYKTVFKRYSKFIVCREQNAGAITVDFSSEEEKCRFLPDFVKNVG